MQITSNDGTLEVFRNSHSHQVVRSSNVLFGNLVSFWSTPKIQVSVGELASDHVLTDVTTSTYRHLTDIWKLLDYWRAEQPTLDLKHESKYFKDTNRLDFEITALPNKAPELRLHVKPKKEDIIQKWFENQFEDVKTKIHEILYVLFLIISTLRGLYHIQFVNFVLSIAVFGSLFGGNRDLPVA
ncbi:MAG: hypothetical protein QXN55_06365 [Candidatus Nitrosotenuis sp.]